MNNPYKVVEHKCGCQSIMCCDKESILTTWDGLRDNVLTNKICKELNRAYEKGLKDGKPQASTDDDSGQSAVLGAGYGG